MCRVTDNLGLATWVANKYRFENVDMDDLIQVARVGLIEADKAYIEGGVPFASFARRCIMNEIMQYLLAKADTVRIPRTTNEVMVKIKKVKGYEDIFDDDLAKRFDCEVWRVKEAKNINKNNLNITRSLNEVIRGSENIELFETLADERNDIDQMIIEHTLNNAINTLNKREQIIIKDLYYEDKTQTRIAEELNLSQPSISKIEKKVMKKLRGVLNGEGQR